MNSKKHSAATGGPAKIGAKVGQVFKAHDGYISGKNLALVKNRLVVQSWRGADWGKKTPDSTLVLSFSDGRVDLVHSNVPDAWASALKNGWHEYYWAPWKNYLRKKGK